MSQERTVSPFLPHVIKKFPNVRDFTISSGGDEAYFTVQSHLSELSVISFLKKKNGKWLSAQIAPFSGKFKDLEPFLSPDGLRLYFASNRPLDSKGDESKDFDIWYVERKTKNSTWSTPINMGEPINSEHNEFYPAVSNAQTIYFTSDGRDTKGRDDILRSAWINGAYSEPESLGEAINSEGYEFNAYIAPDESFLIFSGYNRPDGIGSGDLYISFRGNDGIWEEAQSLGSPINSEKIDYCPFVDIKTKTLYFTSKRTSIGETPIQFTSLKGLLEELNRYDNGLSRIYQTSLSDWIDKKK